MITSEDTARIQQEIGKLALEALRVDVDGFLEVTDQVGSPQALAAGINPKAVSSASDWSELARLLKPFRDEAVRRVAQIRKEAEPDADVIELNHGCPNCGERFVDRLSISVDGSVVCAACGTRYELRGPESTDA